MFYHEVLSLDYETICRVLGLFGFAIYVTAFMGLCLGKLESSKPLYFVMILIAASCVMASLWADFNLSAALIQAFYIFMSFGGIMLRLRGWQVRPKPTSPVAEG